MEACDHFNFLTIKGLLEEAKQAAFFKKQPNTQTDDQFEELMRDEAMNSSQCVDQNVSNIFLTSFVGSCANTSQELQIAQPAKFEMRQPIEYINI